MLSVEIIIDKIATIHIRNRTGQYKAILISRVVDICTYLLLLSIKSNG